MANEGERRVLTHAALRPSVLDVGVPANQIETISPRHFTLESCWVRGNYEGSLFAPSDDRSFKWRGDFIRDQFPELPPDRRGQKIDPARLWNSFGQLNGSPQIALQRRLGLDAGTLGVVLDTALQRGLLYRLLYWTPTGVIATRQPLVYVSDSGLLHRLLDARNPQTLPEPLRGKSYEGFAIASLIDAAGAGVIARVWASGQDEIDLVLEWPGKPQRWAIEISRSPYKRLSIGFHRGCEAVSPSRAIVVQGNAGLASDGTGVERMRLTEALQEVREISGLP